MKRRHGIPTSNGIDYEVVGMLNRSRMKRYQKHLGRATAGSEPDTQLLYDPNEVSASPIRGVVLGSVAS